MCGSEEMGFGLVLLRLALTSRWKESCLLSRTPTNWWRGHFFTGCCHSSSVFIPSVRILRYRLERCRPSRRAASLTLLPDDWMCFLMYSV